MAAIRSHLLQRNGILTQLAENGRIWELREDDLFTGTPGQHDHYYFDLVHIKRAFTFWGFCQPHDHELFAEIETRAPDLDNIRSARLYSYRAFLNELQKIENNLDWCHPYFAHPWRHGQFYATRLRGFREQCYEVRTTETGLVVFAPAVAALVRSSMPTV